MGSKPPIALAMGSELPVALLSGSSINESAREALRRNVKASPVACESLRKNIGILQNSQIPEPEKMSSKYSLRWH